MPPHNKSPAGEVGGRRRAGWAQEHPRAADVRARHYARPCAAGASEADDQRRVLHSETSTDGRCARALRFGQALTIRVASADRRRADAGVMLCETSWRTSDPDVREAGRRRSRPAPRAARDRYVVKSIVHAAEILWVFQFPGEALRLRDVMERTGFTKGMCFRLLYTLHHCGLVEKVDEQPLSPDLRDPPPQALPHRLCRAGPGQLVPARGARRPGRAPPSASRSSSSSSTTAISRRSRCATPST